MIKLMNDPIEIKNLKKYFGATKAVDNISLLVEKGDIFGFLGPNGAGKTTTIRAMMGFIAPTAGQIKILGFDALTNRVILKQKIGYLTSDLRLYDNWTGQDHINFIAKFRGKSKIINVLIKKFNFDKSTQVKYLSTGNKQKLGLILALMNNSDVLILDEPTRGLDPILQNTFYEILGDLKKQGITVFMSSHNLPEVERVCDKVAVIKDGKIVANETIESIKEKKIHLVSAYFYEKINKNNFKFANTEIITADNDKIQLKVKGDINKIIGRIAKYKIKDIKITYANLEDIFLDFYKK